MQINCSTQLCRIAGTGRVLPSPASTTSSCLMQLPTYDANNMVLLTVTKAMLEAIRFCEANTGQERFVLSESGASGLGRLELGDAIGHERLIDISRCVRNCQGLDHQATGARPKPITSSALDSLLRHSRVFVKPPAPKDEPVSWVWILVAYLISSKGSRQSTEL